MATSTAERTRTRSLTSATAIPQETPEVGEDGFPVRMWMVDGVPTPFSLRPFEPHERTVYWNPQGDGAPMWWRAQERNEWGLQPRIQTEVWIAAKFEPRNAWEEHMTREWLTTVDGGANAAAWVGYDHPKNRPGEPPHHWICGDCGCAYGPYAAFEQHQRSKRHSGMREG